ncbi:MAG: MFS transporter [Candidatus Eremiobacter antarcticus]
MIRSLTRDQRNTFIASFLGWMLDAFDFFLVVLVLSRLASDFQTSVPRMASAITLTLMMRPLGALIFGLLADRYGRRVPLMIDIAFYSAVELASAFAPSFGVFLILRALYGIGMGGEWGVGSALVMESLPPASRGLFSGILQEGYAAGYLLAAAVYGLVFPHYGWRGMFVIGAAPALLVFFIRSAVPESAVWRSAAKRSFSAVSDLRQAFASNAGLFVYAIALMTAFNFMSHGTQDLFPTFLQKQRGLGTAVVSTLTIVMNVGAIFGGVFFGHLSQTLGRRRCIITAGIFGILAIPLWIWAPSIVLLGAGAFAMQFMVQGAWGIIPAHLNELSPALVRGTFPGFTYQMGNLLSAGAAQLEASFAKKFPTVGGGVDYGLALSIIALIVFAAVVTLTALGKEARDVDFRAQAAGVLGAQRASPM